MAASDITEKIKTFMVNKVQKVTAIGYTPAGTTALIFKETQETDTLNKLLTITTVLNQITNKITYKFDKNGRVLNIIDSSAGLVSRSVYTYDSSGKLVVINNVIKDSSQDFTQTETHLWVYKNNIPEKMWRFINLIDSVEVRFKSDENGNVIEEQNFKKGKGSDPTYYYYDDKNRLTDIVRYNTKAKKILPDFMFEYDEKDRVIQKISTISNVGLGYLIWRYLFDERGLKTKEALFNKEKQLQGRIDYSFNKP